MPSINDPLDLNRNPPFSDLADNFDKIYSTPNEAIVAVLNIKNGVYVATSSAVYYLRHPRWYDRPLVWLKDKFGK